MTWVWGYRGPVLQQHFLATAALNTFAPWLLKGLEKCHNEFLSQPPIASTAWLCLFVVWKKTQKKHSKNRRNRILQREDIFSSHFHSFMNKINIIELLHFSRCLLMCVYMWTCVAVPYVYVGWQGCKNKEDPSFPTETTASGSLVTHARFN